MKAKITEFLATIAVLALVIGFIVFVYCLLFKPYFDDRAAFSKGTETVATIVEVKDGIRKHWLVVKTDDIPEQKIKVDYKTFSCAAEGNTIPVMTYKNHIAIIGNTIHKTDAIVSIIVFVVAIIFAIVL